MTRNVAVQLPGPLVWELWRIAEARRVSVADVIMDGLKQKPVRPPSAAEVTRSRVVAMVEAGMDDGSIAVELDRTRGYVADVRRKYGLSPNKRTKEGA